MSSTKTTPVRYAIISTPRGWCGVVGGDRGVVRIFLPGPGREALVREIQRSCREAVESDRLHSEALQLKRYFEGNRIEGEWQLDLRGHTPFQLRVWDVLRRIPRGEVRTYGWVAAALGIPGAARAVGAAAGANPCPVIVPCHRVVCAGGGLGGFSAAGGWMLKAEMLRGEGVAVCGKRVDVLSGGLSAAAGTRAG